MQGKTINGFELKRQLGVGGMAEVWYAENRIGKKAAVKLLLPKLCQDENVVSRFLTEAKVMVDLNHPYIRQVYDYGDIDGRPAIVMEYLEGDDLKARMKRGQRFTDEELRKWWNQLVSALNYTHQKGIVHRDIKPGNIFVDTDGNIKLLDFGIAKVRENISSTQTGQKLGTLMYMSPEQVKDSKHIDYRTDIYSLAVTFVHLITGKKPYDSDTSSDYDIQVNIVTKPLDLSGLPTEWRNFLTPYLNKEASQRPDLRTFDAVQASRTTQAVEDDGTIVEGTSKSQAEPATNLQANGQKQVESKKPKGKKKWPWLVVAGVAVVFLVIVGVDHLWYDSDAYEKKFLSKTYKIDIPKGFEETSRIGRKIFYQDGQGALIRVYGGHVYYTSASSALDLLNDTPDNDLVINKNLFDKTTIGFQQAMYAIEDRNPNSYQEAVIYSENTGGYYIHCEYPTNRKSYYEGMMKEMIFSFKECK